MTNRFFYLLAFVLIIFSAGCDDDDPVIENPEEEITSVVLTLSPDGGGDDYVLNFSDTDGDGGNAPVFTTTGTLAANATYSGSINFANEDEDVNVEIMAEDDEHQVFYVVSSGLEMTLAYNDQDGNGAPLGLLTNVTTAAAGTGTITITLRHEPAKDPAVAIDNPAAAGGETDVEVSFDVIIQ